MREKAVRFGKTATLAGIVTEPPGGRSEEAPAVILLNSGILHRVGACRLHVTLARRLAEAGFVALRFDFSGIGDSEPRRDSLSFEKSAALETQEAMDYLSASRGARRFVLVGLCSGADVAHQVGLLDARVMALGLLDPWAYRTPRYYLQHYATRARSPAAWRTFLAHRLRRLTAARGAREVGPADADHEIPRYVREFPPRERVAKDLAALMERQVPLLLIFSGGQLDHYNHEGQYRAAFPSVDFGARLTEIHLAESDHIFTGLDDQARIHAAFLSWARPLHPGMTASAPPPRALVSLR